MVLLALVSEEPFSSVHKAEVSFHALERSFVKYKKALGDCSPEYDVQPKMRDNLYRCFSGPQ